MIDAYGISSAGSLCIANPTVRRYAACLLTDLSSQYEPDTIVLEQFSFRQFEPPPLMPKSASRWHRSLNIFSPSVSVITASPGRHVRTLTVRKSVQACCGC